MKKVYNKHRKTYSSQLKSPDFMHVKSVQGTNIRNHLEQSIKPESSFGSGLVKNALLLGISLFILDQAASCEHEERKEAAEKSSQQEEYTPRRTHDFDSMYAEIVRKAMESSESEEEIVPDWQASRQEEYAPRRTHGFDSMYAEIIRNAMESSESEEEIVPDWQASRQEKCTPRRTPCFNSMFEKVRKAAMESSEEEIMPGWDETLSENADKEATKRVRQQQEEQMRKEAVERSRREAEEARKEAAEQLRRQEEQVRMEAAAAQARREVEQRDLREQAKRIEEIRKQFIQDNRLNVPKAFTYFGLSCFATFDQVKIAYKQSSMRAHPDKGGSLDQIKQVNAQFEILQAHFRQGIYEGL